MTLCLGLSCLKENGGATICYPCALHFCRDCHSQPHWWKPQETSLGCWCQLRLLRRWLGITVLQPKLSNWKSWFPPSFYSCLTWVTVTHSQASENTRRPHQGAAWCQPRLCRTASGIKYLDQTPKIEWQNESYFCMNQVQNITFLIIRAIMGNGHGRL